MIDKARLQTAIRSPKTRKYGLYFVIAVALFSVVGFFVLPPIVKSVLLDQLGKALHREVAIKSIRINPYAMSATVEGLAIKEREGAENFVSFDSLYLNAEAKSIFRGGPVLKEIRLVNPKVRIVRQAENRYNFSDLLDEFQARPKSDAPTPRFSLNNIQLSGGEVEFIDRVNDEKHVVNEISLALPFVSSMDYATDIFVEPLLSARIDGSPLAVKGRSKPFAKSLQSEIDIGLDDLQLAKYIDYSPVKLPVKLLSGALDTDLKLSFSRGEGRPPALLLTGTAAVRDLKVEDAANAPLVSFKTLEVAVGSADLLAPKFVIERVAVDAPEVSTRVSKEGTINWLQLLPQEPAGKPVPAAGKTEAAAPLAWSLGEAKVSGGALRWFDESRGKPFKASIEAIEASLRNLASDGKEKASFELAWRVIAEEWLRVDQVTIKSGQLDLARREVVIGDARTRGARGLIRRAADGTVEWVKPPGLRVVEKARKDESAPWKISVTKFSGEDIGVRFEDKAVSPAATHNVSGLALEVTNLSTDSAKTAKVRANFKLNNKGNVAVDGTLKPLPLDANLNLDVKTVELLPLQPYFSEKLNIDITRGLVTVNGALQLRTAESEKAGEGGLSGGFSGQATVGDFYAVDKINSADFLRWKSFYLGKVDVRLKPDSVSIGEVALSDFFARVIVSPEGKLNLLQIMRQDGAEKPATGEKATASPAADAAPAPSSSREGKASAPVAAAKPMMPIRIGSITLQGGNVRFTDNFIKPNYTANLRKIGGRISGLSSEAGSVASLDLRGSYDNIAPLNITAKINPLSAKPYLDLQADVKGIEMTAFSPYSGKYAGYAIEKGKLSLFVNYKIANDQLQAENRLFLDQLTFGEKVESPDATKLPVLLAVSLLKNRKGEIDVNLPISGSLNDPQFSIGGLVIKVIVNLIVKAVTSPFALIGSVFGSGEELSYIEFDFGRARLTPAAEKTLETLAKALVDRPGLRLEIEGQVDPEPDREGLKQARIGRKVRALKREDLTRKNVDAGSAETVEVSEAEYPALLERAYRAEKFPKPRNVIGMVKTLPVAEMEKLMIANSVVDEEDLQDLGERRAKEVLDWLAAHEVPPERMFLLPSKLLPAESKPEGEQKGRNSRANFSLK